MYCLDVKFLKPRNAQFEAAMIGYNFCMTFADYLVKLPGRDECVPSRLYLCVWKCMQALGLETLAALWLVERV